MVSNFSSVGELGGLFISTIFGFLAVSMGWRLSSIILGIVPIMVLVYIIRHDRKNKILEVKVPLTKSLPFKVLMENKKLIYGLACSFMDNIASSSVLLFIPFLLVYYKYGEIYIPIISAFAFIGSFIGKYFSGRLSDRYSTAKVFIISEICMSLLVILMALTSNITILLIIAFLLGIVTKGTVPIYQVMVADSVDKPEIKSTVAMEIVTNNTGTLVSGIMFGIIGDVFGTPAIFIGFGIAALFAVVPGVLYARAKQV
jgi:MFS family permease